MKPMLAGTPDSIKDILYPCYSSFKYDGIRCLITMDGPRTRKLKEIPNPHIRDLLSDLPTGLDGELISGLAYAQNVFNKSQSAVMNTHGEPDFQFFVFDIWSSNLPFRDRMRTLQAMNNLPSFVKVVRHELLTDEEDLLNHEKRALDLGYEGLITRGPRGFYKFGRSTVKEQGMLKVKRFQDSEARILEVIEEMENTNEQKTNELGARKRSHQKAGMVPKGRMGSLRVIDIKSGVEFHVGSGFDDETRSSLWAIRASLPGRIFTYKFQPTGVKDKPRFPTFKSFRGD